MKPLSFRALALLLILGGMPAMAAGNLADTGRVYAEDERPESPEPTPVPPPLPLPPLNR